MFTILKLLLAFSLANTPLVSHQQSRAPIVPLPGIRGAYLVRIDPAKSAILFSQNPDAPVPLASITKLMAAIVLSEQSLNMNSMVMITKDDIKGGTIPYLIPGDEVHVRDLWNLMLIVSSNDATTALIRTTGKTETDFVATMNVRAKSLGLTHTHFADPSGLDSGNISTAREIAAIARVAFSIPTIANEKALGEYVFTPKNQTPRRAKATNLFTSSISLSGFELLGTKTGHIEESGYNLVVAARLSADKVGKKQSTMIGVITGAPSVWERFTLMRRMLIEAQ